MTRRCEWRLAATFAAALGLAGPVLAQDESMDELVSEGADLFAENCVACHGESGDGTANGPALDGNDNVESRALVVSQILWGDSEHGMPSYADILGDREVAAIATYIRSSWGNDYGVVYPRSVELRR